MTDENKSAAAETVSYRFHGNVSDYKRYVPAANLEMSILINQAKFQGLAQDRREKILSDGTKIICSKKAFGLNTIDVFIPGKIKQEDPEQILTERQEFIVITLWLRKNTTSDPYYEEIFDTGADGNRILPTDKAFCFIWDISQNDYYPGFGPDEYKELNDIEVQDFIGDTRLSSGLAPFVFLKFTGTVVANRPGVPYWMYLADPYEESYEDLYYVNDTSRLDFTDTANPGSGRIDTPVPDRCHFIDRFDLSSIRLESMENPITGSDIIEYHKIISGGEGAEEVSEAWARYYFKAYVADVYNGYPPGIYFDTGLLRTKGQADPQSNVTWYTEHYGNHNYNAYNYGYFPTTVQMPDIYYRRGELVPDYECFLRQEVLLEGYYSKTAVDRLNGGFGYYNYRVRMNSPLTQKYDNILDDFQVGLPSLPYKKKSISEENQINTDWISFMSGEWDGDDTPVPETYTISYSAGDGGTITGDASQEVESGGDGSPVTAVPDDGYSFIRWSDGSTSNPRTDTSVSGDISVSAVFGSF